MHYRNLIFLSGFLPAFVYAEFVPEQQSRVAEPKLPPQAVISAQHFANASGEISETEQALLTDGELARQVLNRAIDVNQFHLLPKLIEIYQQTAQPDTILLSYAKGIVAYQQGHLAQAILQFQQILAEHPQFQPVRLRLAQALFDDFKNQAAKAEFEQLLLAQPPAAIINLAQQYQQAIEQREKWQLSLGLNYLYESNVNNASKAEYIYIGNVPFKKNAESLPQSAKGLNYSLNLSKKMNLSGSHYLAFENSFSGKSYWNNHQFDDQTNRVSLGYQFQNATSRLGLLPFYEWRWYANHRYSQGKGLRLEADRWLNRNWQLSAVSENGWAKHRNENRLLDSRNWLGSTTLLYAFNQTSHIYVGGDYLRDKTRDRAFASIKKSVRVGWGQKWGDFATRLQLNYAHRNFDKPHKLLMKVRKDRELGVNLSLWHTKFNIGGITPKVVYSYSRIHSNLDSLYSTRKQRIYLDFSKVF